METLRGRLEISDREWIPQLQTEGNRGRIPPIVRTGIGAEDDDGSEITDVQLALAFCHLSVEELAVLPGLDETLEKYIFSEPIDPVDPKKRAAFVNRARYMGLVRERPITKFVRNVREYLGALWWP